MDLVGKVIPAPTLEEKVAALHRAISVANAAGITSVNDIPKADLQQNARWGTTISQALNQNNSIKFYFGTGAIGMRVIAQ
jgi:predicted amidohydrolase YtcJ